MSGDERLTFELVKLSENRTQYRLIMPRISGVDEQLKDTTLHGDEAKARTVQWMLAYCTGFAAAYGLEALADALRALADRMALDALIVAEAAKEEPQQS